MNTITLELCAEDRARLAHLTTAMDKLTEALEKISIQAVTAEPVESDEVQQALTKVLAQAETTAAPTEEPAEVETPTAEETPTETAKTDDKPTVTLEQIQQKVVQLCAATPGKKAQVRAVITAYAPTVTALKDIPDVWTTVWEQLTALEG